MRIRAVSICISVVCVALLAGGCNWSQLGFDSSHAGYNIETSITTANVSTLTEKFTTSQAVSYSQPAIVNGVMYVVSNGDALDAYSAQGSAGCSGAPTTCKPLWSASIGGPAPQTPAVVDGKVFILNTATQQVDGFDAAGQQNCSGTPTVCTPVWEASVNNGEGQSLTVSNGRLYVTAFAGATSSAGDVVDAFDVSGTTNCSGTPTMCTPVWSSTAFGAGTYLQGFSVSVAHGVVYALTANEILAFDANGTTDCTGTPTVCSPLWQYTGLAASATAYGVISGSTLFVDTFQISGSPTNPTISGALDAYDANGVTNCSGTPKVCTPLWQTGAGTASQTAPIVANGFVFVPTFAGPIAAFDVSGSTNCSGIPKTCSALWTTSNSVTGGGASVVVGGDVLYAAPSSNFTATAYAFDASGSAGCASSVCSPLWTSPSVNFANGALTIANGTLYVSERPSELSNSSVIAAYGLPS